MLYRNCLDSANGNEEIAKDKVREKYERIFLNENDIYFVLGTTLRFHNVAPNPFIIIGVLYPPKGFMDTPHQMSLLDL